MSLDPNVVIGILGGPGSGKSTYIAALRHAALQDSSRSLTIMGADEAYPGSTNYLANQTALLDRLDLPRKTVDSERDYGYYFKAIISWDPESGEASSNGSGEEMGGIAGLMTGVLRQNNSVNRVVNGFIHLQDFPGDFLIRQNDPEDKIWRHLSECTGLVFLFDPEKERYEIPNNYHYMERALDYIAVNRRKKFGPNRGDITARIAICISKIDRAHVIAKLIALDLMRVIGPNAFSLADPGAAFHALADERLREMIERYLEKSVARHFWLSSVGFNTQDVSSSRLNPSSLDNVQVVSEEESKLKTPIRPFGVLESFLWLIGGDAPRRAGGV